MNEQEIRIKLSKHIIDKSKPEWKAKKINPSGREVEIPDSLNGELLLEEDIRDGKVYGWYTVHPAKFAEIMSNILDPTKPDITEDTTGYRKHLDKWRNEGIGI